MADGFTVNRAALTATAKGISDTIGALKKIGIDEEAETGRWFSSLSLRGLQVGHSGLHVAFGDFCDRWSWGVRSLVQDGTEIAVRLGLTVGAYYDSEQYVIAAMKDIAADAVGDPHLPDGRRRGDRCRRLSAATPR